MPVSADSARSTEDSHSAAVLELAQALEPVLAQVLAQVLAPVRAQARVRARAQARVRAPARAPVRVQGLARAPGPVLAAAVALEPVQAPEPGANA